VFLADVRLTYFRTKRRSLPKRPARSAVVVRRLMMVMTRKRRLLLQLPNVAKLKPIRLLSRMMRPINLQRRRLALASQLPTL